MLIVLAVDGYATLLERVIGNKIGGISVERLTYDFCIAGNHCWQVKGADNLECSEVCKSREDEGCNGCPIANAFDRLAAIEDILGDDYDLDRLKELVRANREGKCVVLPCKDWLEIVFGEQEVFYGIDMDYIEHPIREISVDSSSRCTWYDGWKTVVLKGYDENGLDWEFSPEEIGKIVFLTREEAEAALEKMKEDK